MDDPTFNFFAVIFMIAVAIMSRLFAGSMDAARISEYISSKGGRLTDKSWEPFGPGWWGEKNARIYRISYLDRDGNSHAAYVKTSMMSGVYLSEDKVIRKAKVKPKSQKTRAAAKIDTESTESLKAENAALRAKIRDLENQD